MDFTKISTVNTTNLSLSPVSESIQTLISLIYGTIALLSFTFNLATIFVLLKCKICSEVNAYLINLSVSDLIMSCLCIPYTFTTFVLNRWIFPDILCPVANFAQICSIVVSIWTLTTIGVDRFFATINPLGKRYKFLGIKWRSCHEHKTMALVTIWLLGLSVGLFYSWNVHVIEFQFMGKIFCDCREDLSVSEAKFLTVFLFVFTFGLPLLILVFVYSVIGYQVWCHVTPGNAHQIRDQQSILTREKVIKILILIVVFFFICWAPLQTFHILVEFVDNFLQIDSNDVLHQQLYVYGYLTVHMLAMSHSFVNPVIYCFSSKNFWTHFCHLFRKTVWFATNNNNHNNNNNYNLNIINLNHHTVNNGNTNSNGTTAFRASKRNWNNQSRMFDNNNPNNRTIDTKLKSNDNTTKPILTDNKKLVSAPSDKLGFESVQCLLYKTTDKPSSVSSFHCNNSNNEYNNNHRMSNGNGNQTSINSSVIVCNNNSQQTSFPNNNHNYNQTQTRAVWLDF